MKSPKILFISHTYPPKWDGVARCVYELYEKFKNNSDFIANVITTNYKHGNTKLESDILTEFKPKLIINDFPVITDGFIKIKKHIKQADVIICCDAASLSTYAIFWGNIYRKKIISWKHVNIDEIVYFSINNKLKATVAKVISVFHSEILSLFSDLVVLNGNVKSKSNKAKTLLPAISKDLLPNRNSILRERLKLAEDDFVVCYAGRLSPEKGVENLVRITKMLNKYPEIKVIIIGDGNFAHKFSNNENCIYLKRTNKIYDYLQIADVQLILSKTETGPLILLEAMFCETVPFSTSVGVAESLIENGINGYLIGKDINDIDNYIVDTIHKLSRNKELLNRMKTINKKNANENFLDWNDTYNFFKNSINILTENTCP
jgi:glycosyltransferase involved in cell wall biosynthesis